MTDIQIAEGSGPQAQVLPHWIRDGKPITIKLDGFTDFAGQTVRAVVSSLDSVSTDWRMTIPVALDGSGNGSVEHSPGLQIGNHAAIWVTGIEHSQGFARFSHMFVNIANSPTTGATLGDLSDQFALLERAQVERYAVPLGDASATGAREHRALCVLEGIYVQTELRAPGAMIHPIDGRPTDPERMAVINNELVRLQWPTRVPEDRWLAATAASSPMTAIVCPQIWAPDLDAAAETVREIQEKLTGILALNRKATGRLVAIVLEQRQPDGGVKFRVYPPNDNYTGNLAVGVLAGEDQRSLLTQFRGSDADPLVRLCCDLYGEALAERSPDARYLRLWSILEFLSASRLPVGQTVGRRDGTAWPGPHNTTSSAAPRIYAYLDQVLAGGQIDETSTVAPASDLYEAVRTWYGRRNATGHYGRFVPGDATQTSQRWYKWAVKTLSNEWGWLDSLTRMVELSVRMELQAAAPSG